MEAWLSVVCLFENTSGVLILMTTGVDCYGLLLLVGETLFQPRLPFGATIIIRFRLQHK